MCSEYSDEIPLEIHLTTVKSISDSVWKKIRDAVSYDSATPVRWAVSMLKIIYVRVLADEQISVPHLGIVLTKWNFKEVVTKQFSDFIFSEVLKVK